MCMQRVLKFFGHVVRRDPDIWKGCLLLVVWKESEQKGGPLQDGHAQLRTLRELPYNHPSKWHKTEMSGKKWWPGQRNAVTSLSHETKKKKLLDIQTGRLALMLSVACLTLHHYSYDLTDVPTLMLCTGTYVGFVIVLSGEIIGEMIFAPLDLVQDMYFGILGVGLFSTCGGLVLSARTKTVPYPRTGDYNVAILVGSLAILNALVMLFDLSLAYLDSEEFDDDTSV